MPSRLRGHSSNRDDGAQMVGRSSLRGIIAPTSSLYRALHPRVASEEVGDRHPRF